MKIIRSFYIVTFCALFLGGYTRAVIVITTATGTGADSYVNYGSNQGVNYGSSETAQVLMGSSNDYLRKAYFRFDLSSVSGSITEATLSFRVTSPDNLTGGGPVKLYGLNDGVTGEDWSETGITWSNAPANTLGDTAALDSNATELAAFANINSTTTTVNFTSEILSFLQADTDNNVTFIVTGGSYLTGSPIRYNFYTKENTSTEPFPTLAITTIPEPSSIALILIALTTLVWVRRR